MNFLERHGNVELRALSWKEPFGSLMLHGKIETRKWDTKYRGWVLICLSKAPYNNFQILNIAGSRQFGRIEETAPINGKLGWAIAVGKLVDSRLMTPADEDKCFVQYREPWHEENKNGILVEKKLWCHVYEDVQPIEPKLWFGKQGWSTIEDYAKKLIEFK